MKKDILVDIDVIIEYLKTGEGSLPEAYENYKMKIISTTYTELLASKTFEDAALKKEVQDFLKKYFNVLDVTESIADTAADVLREKKLSLATSLVAAASISSKMPLLTNDEKSYKGIDGVEILSV